MADFLVPWVSGFLGGLGLALWALLPRLQAARHAAEDAELERRTANVWNDYWRGEAARLSGKEPMNHG